MNIFDYLAFRRKIVFLDEWLSYTFLVWIYYYFEERNWWIMGPIVGSIVLMNGAGYYYLDHLERHCDLYGFHRKGETSKLVLEREPLAGLLVQPVSADNEKGKNLIEKS